MRRRKTTLRRQLLLLAVATALPLLVFSAAVILWVSQLHRATAHDALTTAADSMASTIDHQLETWKAALAALATSPALESGDWETFYRQAKTVSERVGGWIVVSLPSGQQIANTRVPFGTSLPHSHPAVLPPSLLYGGADDVSDLFEGRVAEQPVLAVNVPAVRDGVVTHALHLGITPAQLEEILAGDRLPEGCVAGLIDGHNRVIARAPALAAVIGTKAADWYSKTTEGAQRGITTGTAVDGTGVFVAFERLSNAPWTIAVALPTAELARAWRHPLALLAGGGAVFVLVISLVSVRLAARLTGPIDDLATAARAARRGESVPEVPPMRIRELDALRRAVVELAQKQVLLREANHRIKNNLQLISASLGVHGQRAADEASRDLMLELQAHVQAIARLHDRFYTEDRYDEVDAFALTRAVCADIAEVSAGRASVRVDAPGEALIASAAAGPFALIVAELIMNAVKHASAGGTRGTIEVRGRTEAGPTVVVVVSDDGPGLPAGFDLEHQSGMGLRMCRSLAAQIDGSLRAVPAARGAAFELRAPGVTPAHKTR